jgi:hypothetical protein
VPAKKPLPSGHGARLVTRPTSAPALSRTLLRAGFTRATVPSPPPTSTLVAPVAALSRQATDATPRENFSLEHSLRVGRTVSGSLQDWMPSRSILKRSTSPVRVPQTA